MQVKIPLWDDCLFDIFSKSVIVQKTGWRFPSNLDLIRKLMARSFHSKRRGLSPKTIEITRCGGQTDSTGI
jgi:hypothetical protein